MLIRVRRPTFLNRSGNPRAGPEAFPNVRDSHIYRVAAFRFRYKFAISELCNLQFAVGKGPSGIEPLTSSVDSRCANTGIIVTEALYPLSYGPSRAG